MHRPAEIDLQLVYALREGDESAFRAIFKSGLHAVWLEAYEEIVAFIFQGRGGLHS